MEILNNLDPTLRIFWYIAIPSTVIFIIQTILAFAGGDAGEGADMDVDADSIEGDISFFSLRSLINFLLGASWGGISFFNSIENTTFLIQIALLIGLLFVVGFYYLMKELYKLGEDNSFRIEETIGKTAEVYLRIPPQKSGKGKVLVSIKGSVRELEAMTEENEIPSNASVMVEEVLSKEILLVRSLA